MNIFKMLFCKHKYKFERNLHGDEINAVSTARKTYRSWWYCEKCGKHELREQLNRTKCDKNIIKDCKKVI
jgi:hypothetical protein